MCFWEFNTVDLRKTNLDLNKKSLEEKKHWPFSDFWVLPLFYKHCNLTVTRRFGSWPTNDSNPVMSLTCVTWDRHRAGRKAVTWECKARAASRHLCARVLPPASCPGRMSAIHATPASCPPGCWLDLLKRAGWPVGPQIWCPLFTWADAELDRCSENTLGVKTLLSFTPFSQQRIKQPFVFTVGYFHKES